MPGNEQQRGDVTARRAERMTISNIDTGRTISAQFNPAEINEELAVNYQMQQVLGMSHKLDQYQSTDNLKLTFDMEFDILAKGDDPEFARRFLQAACYSSRNAQDVIGGGPPELLFVWPRLFTLRCRIERLKFHHKRFNLSLQSTCYTASISIFEVRDVRLYSEDVLNAGTLRGE